MTQAQMTPVGWGRPPANSQFKPGISGNPKGRPRGSRGLAKLLTEILSERITVVEGTKQVRMSKAEAIVQVLMNKAIKGDGNAMSGVLALASKIGRLLNEPEPPLRTTGYLVVPERCDTVEEWYRRHGAAARGDHHAHRYANGQMATKPFTVETGLKLMKEKRLDDALACFRLHLATFKPKLADRPVDPKIWNDCVLAVQNLQDLSFIFTSFRRGDKALEIVDEAISELKDIVAATGTTGLESELMVFDLCRACALIFVGQHEEARPLILRHRGKTLFACGIDMPWEPYVWRLFEKLREVGANHPFMDEIEAQLRAEVAPADDQHDSQVVRGRETARGALSGEAVVEECSSPGESDMDHPSGQARRPRIRLPASSQAPRTLEKDQPRPKPFYDENGTRLYKSTKAVSLDGSPTFLRYERL